MKEIEYWIWISSLEGISPSKVLKLLKTCKNPELVYGMTSQQLRKTGFLTDRNIQELLDKEKRERVKDIYDLMVCNDIKLINIFDSCYPQNLREIFDAPVALYYKGRFEIHDFAIAIVGSRRITNYGSCTARRLSYDLSIRGVQIVSGLARGIDSIAHEGCLAAGGKTIAVLGCGLDNIYPPENTALFEEIINSGGLAISEYAPGMPPLPHNFPARNRIISGISSGVLVVEAARRSGSLITAAYALEQGREVFAVPGNIDYTFSMGTNQLIKEGAKMVMCAEDVLEEFSTGLICPKSDNINSSVLKGLSTQEIRIVKIISNGTYNIDEIIDKSNISVKEVNNLLFMLEMKGVIVQKQGKSFELL